MTNYFSHDSNARNDVRILSLRMKHGAAGYAAYFMILERMRDDSNYRCFVGNDGETSGYDILAFDLRVEPELVRSVINDFGLFFFSEDGNYAYSRSFLDRMAAIDETSAKRSAAARKRWEKTAENTISELTAQPVSSSPSIISNMYDIFNRLQKKGVPSDDMRYIVKLLNLGTAPDTQLYVGKIEKGTRYQDVIDELRKEEATGKRQTTTFLAVQMVEEVAKVVPDATEQQTIISLLYNRSKEEIQITANRIKELVSIIRKKAQSPTDAVHLPGRFIIKSLGL